MLYLAFWVAVGLTAPQWWAGIAGVAVSGIAESDDVGTKASLSRTARTLSSDSSSHSRGRAALTNSSCRGLVYVMNTRQRTSVNNYIVRVMRGKQSSLCLYVVCNGTLSRVKCAWPVHLAFSTSESRCLIQNSNKEGEPKSGFSLQPFFGF